MNKIYHIYAKEKCIMHNVSEDDFKSVWETLYNMIDLLDTQYTTEDLNYEELEVNRDITIESSH
jgi:hypothetical protein